ncbi:MAG: ABC transporter substrate-binding protein, partial [Chloroflexi bacterium]|nr:ABC transporter substrate-binding protein [Chloroflexota bacterium]
AKIVAGHTKGGPEIITMRKDVADRLGITPASKAEDKARAFKGLTVAAQSQAGSGSNLVRFILGTAGLTDQNIELTIITDEAAMMVAMETKRIDVLAYSVPPGAKLALDGTGITLFSNAKGNIPGVPGDKLYASITSLESYGKANPNVVESFVRGLWRGMRYSRQDKAGLIEALSKYDFYTALDPKVLQASTEEMYDTFLADPTLTKDSVQKAIDYLNVFKAANQKLTVQAEQMFTNEYVDAAKKQLGF